jgi:hypothetical protein
LVIQNFKVLANKNNGLSPCWRSPLHVNFRLRLSELADVRGHLWVQQLVQQSGRLPFPPLRCTSTIKNDKLIVEVAETSQRRRDRQNPWDDVLLKGGTADAD